MTIELSAAYLKAVTDALPNAVVVADRFHLVRLANDMLTRCVNAPPARNAPDAAAHATRNGPTAGGY